MATTYKHYLGRFADRTGAPWALLVTFPDTADTAHLDEVTPVRLGMPPATLTTERADALDPIVAGRLAFSLLQEEAHPRDFRHLFCAPEGSVAVCLLQLPDWFTEADEKYLHNLVGGPDPHPDWGRGFWRGTLDPESYEEPATAAAGYLVRFEAGDLGRLKRQHLKRQPAAPATRWRDRLALRDWITALLSCSLSDWERARYGDVQRATEAHIVWAGRHFTRDGRDLYVDTAPFFREGEGEGEAITVYEALERTLRPLSLILEQADGLFVLSDLSALASQVAETESFPALTEDGTLTLAPRELEPMGADGQLTALPSLGTLTLTTRPQLDGVIPAFPLPEIPATTDWLLVPRADRRLQLPAYRLQRTSSVQPGYTPGYLLKSEQITTGEDRSLVTLIYNPRSIHGFISGARYSNANRKGWSVFRIDEAGWEYNRATGRYYNRSLLAVSEDGDIAPLTPNEEQEFFHYASIRSFAPSTLIPRGQLAGYVSLLQGMRDRLNGDPTTRGLPVLGMTRLSFSIPKTGQQESLGLRLDVPLLPSLSPDPWQTLDDKSAETIELMSLAPGGRSYDRPDYKKEAQRALAPFEDFTRSITGVLLYFELEARGEGIPPLFLRLYGDELQWMSEDDRTIGQSPHLFYGSTTSEGALKWSSWNHPNIGVEDFVGEGLHIPLPPATHSRLRLTVFGDLHFYRLPIDEKGKVKQDATASPWRGWNLWSVPGLVALSAPALWVADALGRKDSDLAPDRVERYRYTSATDEDRAEDLYLADGQGISPASPAILRLKDGTPLKDFPTASSADAFAYATLSGYRAECIGAVYGSLPARGFELTGTFRYHPSPALRPYAGMDWVTVLREIDLQALTERGTYHQLRPASLLSQEQLRPDLIQGVTSRGEAYDTTSPRYVDYKNPRTPRRGR